MDRKRILKMLFCLCVLMLASAAAQADEIYVETPLTGADEAQRNNIYLAAQSMNGVRLGFGDEFSFNEIVGPRSAELGYLPAANGRGIEVVGGGVAQTATTLYLALMQRDDIEYSSIYTYNERFTGEYVESGYDAIATDYAAGLDFAFNSYHEGTLAVYMWLDEQALCCYISEEASDRMTRQDGCDGYAVTPLVDVGAQQANVRLAAMSIDGWTMRQGDIFSFNEIVGPRQAQYGFRKAENGRGVKVIGGGVAQAAATVYLAVRDMENVGVVEMRTYGDSFVGEYVDSGDEAVLVDYGGNIDFSFQYMGDDELTVYIYLERDQLVCEVFED